MDVANHLCLSKGITADSYTGTVFNPLLCSDTNLRLCVYSLRMQTIKNDIEIYNIQLKSEVYIHLSQVHLNLVIHNS